MELAKVAVDKEKAQGQMWVYAHIAEYRSSWSWLPQEQDQYATWGFYQNEWETCFLSSKQEKKNQFFQNEKRNSVPMCPLQRE